MSSTLGGLAIMQPRPYPHSGVKRCFAGLVRQCVFCGILPCAVSDALARSRNAPKSSMHSALSSCQIRHPPSLFIVQSLFFLVAAIGGISVMLSEMSRMSSIAKAEGWVVLEKLLDEVDMGHDHPAATVALETKLVHRVAKGNFSKKTLQAGPRAAYPSVFRGSAMSCRYRSQRSPVT